MIQKAKSINSIYEEALHFDLVITNDAPLATAINKLVTVPRIDYLAMTPKQIASSFAGIYMEKLYNKTEAVLNICRETGKPLKLIHGLTDKITDMWKYNAKLEFLEQYLSKDEYYLLELIKKFPSIESAMENFNEEFYGNKKIAVAGEELFTLLDSEVLPRRKSPASVIELFEDSEFHFDKTFIFPSAVHLTENIVRMINNENASNTAIVISPESVYLKLLKVRLAEKGIMTEDKFLLSGEDSVRKLLSFVEFSLNQEGVTVKDFSFFANEFDIFLNSKYFNYDFGLFANSKNKDLKLKKLADISEKIGKYSYSGLINELEKNFSFIIPGEFSNILKLTDLHDSAINQNNLETLKYFLTEIDMEMQHRKRGVLLVNALNSAYIDRHIVFYAGMDNSWMKLFPDKDYMNKEEEEIKNLKRFQILLQQGTSRYFFVQNISDYKEIIPCYYFSQLYGKKIGSFTDSVFNPVFVSGIKNADMYIPVNKKKLRMEAASEIALSPTSINNFFKCPKYFSLNKLLPGEDNQNFTKGTLMHCFAELYFNHPEYTKTNINKIIGIMSEEMKMFNKNLNMKYMNTIFEIAVNNVVNFIDGLNINKIKLSKPGTADNNLLMSRLKKDKLYLNTEWWLPEPDKTKIRGKIDLFFDNTIADYKTSSAVRKPSEVTLQSNLEFILSNEYTDFDFQAIAYLTAYQRNLKEKRFIYNFLLSNIREYVSGKEITSKNLTNIRFINSDFSDFMQSEEVIELVSHENKLQKLFETAGIDIYVNIFRRLIQEKIDFLNMDALTEKVTEVALELLNEKGLNYKSFNCRKQESFINSCIEPVASFIFKMRSGNTDTGYIFKEDSEKFIEFLEQSLNELNEFSNSKFPFRPVFDSRAVCKECDIRNICIGNKIWN